MSEATVNVIAYAAVPHWGKLGNFPRTERLQQALGKTVSPLLNRCRTRLIVPPD
jgi:hypothetical protein